VSCISRITATKRVYFDADILDYQSWVGSYLMSWRAPRPSADSFNEYGISRLSIAFTDNENTIVWIVEWK
jgi:hypothetical protein